MKNEQPKKISKAEFDKISEFKGKPLKPDMPPGILFKAAIFWREQAKNGKMYNKKVTKDRRAIIEGKKEILPTIVYERKQPAVCLHKEDLPDLFLMAHLATEALLRLRFKLAHNMFLNMAILAFAIRHQAVSTSKISTYLGSYRQVGGINHDIGLRIAKLVRAGYLKPVENNKGVYYITTEGREYVQAGHDSFNLVLTSGYRKHDKQAKL